MDLLLVADGHYYRDRKGDVYVQSVFDYNFYKRYLTVFDHVYAVARIEDVDAAPEGKKRCSGEGITFLDFPTYKGPWQYAKSYARVRHVAREYARRFSCAIFRLPGATANIVCEEFAKTGKPFAVEIVIDPWENFAPGSGTGILRPIIRRSWTNTVKRMCMKANGASYVTEHYLQDRYPCPALQGKKGYFTGSYSSVELPDASFAQPRIYETKKTWYIAHTANTLALSIICVTTGSRNLAICVVLSIIVYHYLVNNKRPSIITILTMVACMYLFIGIIGTFRTEIRLGTEIQLNTLTRKSMFRHLMYNLEIFYPFYSLVGMVNNGNMSIHYGLGILNILVQFIPRAIWPSKPANIGLGAIEAMYGNDLVGSAFPNIGEYYYELGLVGMIILMYITGYFGTRIYEKCQKTKNTFRIIKYSIFFGYLMQFINRGHFPSWAYDTVFLIGPIVLIEKIMRLKFNRSRNVGELQ